MEKVKVLIEIQPGVEVTIKPIAVEVAKRTVMEIKPEDNDASMKLSKTATVTAVPGGGDVDVDIDW